MTIKKTMSIIYIANARLPTEKAHGYQIMQMCQAFQENGCDIILLRPHRMNSKTMELVNLSDYYGLRENIKNHKLSTIDFISLFFSKLPVVSRLGLAPLAHYLLTINFAFLIIRFLRSRTYKTSLIFLRDIILAGFLIKGLPKRLARQMIVEVHSISSHSFRQKVQAMILRRVRVVVVLTSSLKRQLVSLGVEKNKILVQPDAVDIESFDLNVTQTKARSYLGLPQKAKIAAYVGKFHTAGMEKGIPEIIRSAKYLIEEFPELLFCFVGGPLDRVQGYEQIIDQEGLPRDRFVFLEKQPVQKVPYYLKASDILLMPHPWNEFYAYHISPLKMFEYMASKRPIIASELPSICEILRHEENSLLGRPGNPEDIAANIKRLLVDRDLAKSLAEKAWHDVQEYTWQTRAKKILDFINSKVNKEADLLR